MNVEEGRENVRGPIQAVQDRTLLLEIGKTASSAVSTDSSPIGLVVPSQ